MDKIWARNPLKSEVILAVVAGMKKRMTKQNRQKANAKNPHKLNLVHTHIVPHSEISLSLSSCPTNMFH